MSDTLTIMFLSSRSLLSQHFFSFFFSPGFISFSAKEGGKEMIGRVNIRRRGRWNTAMATLYAVTPTYVFLFSRIYGQGMMVHYDHYF